MYGICPKGLGEGSRYSAHEFLTAAREGTGSATARGIWLANRVYLLWTVASFLMCDCLRESARPHGVEPSVP